MPIYDYKCAKCGNETTKLLSRKELDTVKLKCNNCGSDEMDRQFPQTGGYQMASGPGSVRPKSAGYRKGK